MITSIHIYVGKVHKHIKQDIWEKLGSEMSKKYDCDLVLRTVEQFNTKLSVQGDLTFDEMTSVQSDFACYLGLN